MRAALLAALTLAACAAPAPDPRRSGFDDMSPQTQAMQRDDTLNPAMLWVGEGAQQWRAAAPGQRSCRDCHGAAETSMRAVATRYPAFDAPLRRPIDLAERVNQCRVRHQAASRLEAESDALLGLTAFIARQSRGLPISPPDDARLAPHRRRGEQLFRQRIGQLNLSCSQCHDRYAGRSLGGSRIPQAHPTGYPLYRLEWQTLGSLQRRLRGCFLGVRAEAPAYGAAELIDLELYLAERARGLALETPAVRP